MIQFNKRYYAKDWIFSLKNPQFGIFSNSRKVLNTDITACQNNKLLTFLSKNITIAVTFFILNLIHMVENAMMVAGVAGPIYLVLGLSTLFYIKTWQKMISDWSKNHLSLFGLAVLELVLGLLVVGTYNNWEWNIWLLVTITGWGMVFDGFFYFLMPGSWYKSLLGLWKSQGPVAVSGLLSVAIGAVLTYHVYFV